MRLGSSDHFIGIICRDKGVFRRSDGSYNVYEMKLGDQYYQKGTISYARTVKGHLDNLLEMDFNKIVVVGDGVSDIKLFGHLGSLLHERGSKIDITGHFLRHPGSLRVADEFDGVNLFDSWGALAEDLRNAINKPLSDRTVTSSTLLIVDIMRTVLWPRNIDDGRSVRMREKAIIKYIQSFSQSALDHPTEALARHNIIRKWIEFCATENVEYNNELSSLYCGNDEILAVLSLLLCMGTILESWIKRPNNRTLSAMIRRSIQVIERGHWVDRLEAEAFGDGRYLVGHKAWRQKKVLYHLEEVLSNIRNERSVISSYYNEFEGLSVAGMLESEECAAFNPYLLGIIRQIHQPYLLFVTDKPSAALNIYMDIGIGTRIGGRFWNTMNLCLSQRV